MPDAAAARNRAFGVIRFKPWVTENTERAARVTEATEDPDHGGRLSSRCSPLDKRLLSREQCEEEKQSDSDCLPPVVRGRSSSWFAPTQVRGSERVQRAKLARSPARGSRDWLRGLCAPRLARLCALCDEKENARRLRAARCRMPPPRGIEPSG